MSYIKNFMIDAWYLNKAGYSVEYIADKYDVSKEYVIDTLEYYENLMKES